MVGRFIVIVIVLAFIFGCSQSFIFTKDKVDCLISQWSEWSQINEFGEHSKQRVILRYPDNGGMPCPTDTEFNEIAPKVDCVMSQWSEWSGIYGLGERSKERVIITHPDNGGKPCPTDTEITEYTTTKPMVHETANQVITSFLQRNLKTDPAPPRGTVQSKIGLFRDLLIIIDSSGSIGSRNFEIAKKQLGELLSLICPLPDPFDSKVHNGNNRAALIQFSDVVIKEFDFDDKHNISDLKSAIMSVPYQNGGTCTGDAFYKAIQMFTSYNKGIRQNTKHEVLILTDGESNCGKDISTLLPTLHANAAVFGLMIGSYSDSGKAELTSYVTKPKPKHLFAVDNFQELETLLNLIRKQIDETNPCAPFDLSKK
ncbi:Hypothetical predicted protein [Mytilus galloprovincialis]|uniref:VWFA domain-containing protein n=1 Tax=Mytilus galloprovincialis TaxID=29158 RepID=A0A8B6EJD4_MYTGA|nr:Hypothetical predicted protein [Mytilus galloprovincialis]